MKERLLNVLKVFFIILGVLFLLQILIGFGIILGLVGFANADFSYIKVDNKKIKQIQPIIKYVEDYKIQNGAYPEKIEGVKVKKGLEYKYSTTKDKNCYTIKADLKDGVIQEYQRCSIDTPNSNSNSESYMEYSK
ncbi:MAG: hypothetical protein IKL52_06615 [Candidatus Gastranaerophilales bacterium]|nr:hypothetical protein [Candidatus Gastranaerophilales bacterium]